MEGWTDEQMADIAAGNKETNIEGIGAKALRTALPDYFTKYWGTEIRKKTFQHYENIDLKDIILTIGSPDTAHQDPNSYCYNERSQLFKNMYLDIWNANGTVNDTNYFARYVSDLVKTYKNQVKFWEILDTPGWDIEGKNGWKPRNWQHNWWENTPDPCEIGIKAPVSHLVRMLRIAYEVIKKQDSTAFVVYSGAGFPSFLDAVCRSTDNPADGTPTPQYSYRGGAYFDAVLYNVFPHFDGSLAQYDAAVGGIVFRRNTDAAVLSIVKQRDSLQSVLSKYGYDNVNLPQKRFIIGEINVPRKSFGASMAFGSDEIQRNFVLKSYITSALNGILQMNLKNLSEETTYDAAQDASQVMGLYQKLPSTPFTRTLNVQGVAFKTINDILFGLKYDSLKTRQLNLPSTIKGGAFRSNSGKFTYALWAVSTGDLAEYGNAIYNFPNTFPSNLYKREWTFTQDRRITQVASQNVLLTTTPIFLSETNALETPPVAAFTSDTRKTCPPFTVHYENKSTDATNFLWSFDGGEPATSTQRNPSVIYRQSGQFNAVLEVNNPQGSHKNKKIEYVFADNPPRAGFEWRRDSGGFFIRFTNTTTNSYTMQWDFGDGFQDFSLHPTHRFTERKIYQVRLIAVNDCGRDTTYKYLDLRTNALTEPLINAFYAAPNPFNDALDIRFNIAKTGNLSLKLYNISGKLMENMLENTFYTEGVFEKNFKTDILQTGIYILQIQMNEQVFYKKLIKM